MANNKKIENNQYWWGCGENESLFTVGRMNSVSMENSMEIPLRVGNRPPF